jgi:CRP/FNR family transcriptional regulator
MPAGKIIFSEGDTGREMYVLIEGEVEISKRTSMETSKTLITLRAGDIFGEMALIENQPRSATAIATKPGKLLALDEALFFNMIERNPDFAKKMIRILSERVRRANHSIQQLVTMNREAIIVNGLQDYAKEHGIQSIKGKRISRDSFALWAESHLGIPSRELLAELDRLVERRVITGGANKSEVLVSG